MLDGKGLAVSEARGVAVEVSVGVAETVCVARGVSVTGGNDVFVGTLVAIKVGGRGVDVRVQANDVRIHRIKKNDFRFIDNLSFQNTILE